MTSATANQFRDPVEVRRRKILGIASREGFVRQAEIAAELDVSTETVRRDLAALQEAGELTRIHGGAVVSSATVRVEPAREERSSAAAAQKAEIAVIAAGLLDPDDTLFLDVGTTAEAVAKALPASFHGVVVTPSLPVGQIVGLRDDIELHLLGGRVRPRELTTFGADTLAQIGSFNASIALIGAGGIGAAGVSDYSGEDAAIKRAMIAQSARSFVLAGYEKIGRTAPRSVCGLGDIDGIITDSVTDDAQLQPLTRPGLILLRP
ncbi:MULTISPECIES: DeoR/GlpR family DNA-binding transcription regulator [Microbacterium]|uniref:DeoR/GlpR family DNA-binding transcription regulator n=1 Tax=Microbacterium TaxID=33882 RepID=UPI0013A54776|nr:DeoR/GlpR family DNA-binding transcription regulator [Microbacterium sp. KCTC 39802]